MDSLTMICPRCSARAEYPDCEECGYDLAIGESSSAVTVGDGRGGEMTEMARPVNIGEHGTNSLFGKKKGYPADHETEGKTALPET